MYPPTQKYYLEEICVFHVHSSKTNSCLAYHWNVRFSCNLKFNYSVEKSLVVVPTTSQMKLNQAFSLRSILILSSHLQPGLPTSTFHLVFRLKCCMHFLSVLCLLHTHPSQPSWFYHPDNSVSSNQFLIFSMLTSQPKGQFQCDHE
jgi:hypothetical protein